jgi:hypothetical protein
VSIPTSDDFGCPDSDFPFGLCAPEGSHCLVSTPFNGVHAVFRCDNEPYSNRPPPGWIHDAFYYDPGAIPPLPQDRLLDTSDCASRPVIPCECFPDETAEDAIERNVLINHCQMVNPIVFVAFDDSGCPARAAYDGKPLTMPNFESCLNDALSKVRFDCATRSTRVVLMTENKE